MRHHVLSKFPGFIFKSKETFKMTKPLRFENKSLDILRRLILNETSRALIFLYFQT